MAAAEQVPKSGSPNSGSPAHRSTAIWWAVMLGSVLLIVLGVATSQSWRGNSAVPLEPPFQAPGIASQLVQEGDIEASFQQNFLLLSAGPPTLPIFLSNAPLASDLRQLQYEGGWEQRWTNPASTWVISTSVIQYRTADTARASSPRCQPETTFIGVFAARAAGAIAQSQHGSQMCADLVKGRTQFTLQMLAPSGVSREQVVSYLNGLLQKQENRLIQDADSPIPPEAAISTRLTFFRTNLLALCGVALLSTLPSVLFDRAAIERLVSRLVRPRRQLALIDAEPLVRRLALQHRAIGLSRFAILLWVLRLTEILNASELLTLCMVGAAVLFTIVIERVLGGRSRRLSTRPLNRSGLLFLAAGLAGSVVLFASALWLFNLGLSLTAGGLLPGVPSWVASRYGIAYQCLGAVVFFLSFTPLALGRRLNVRHGRKEAWNPKTQPVLFLRSFVDDKLRMRSHRLDRAGIIDQLAFRRWERFEEVSANAFSTFGPVVAVGKPGELLPPGLGADRLMFSHEAWQGAVAELANRSLFIAIIIGRSESLVLEMNMLKDMGVLHKVIFLVPPVAKQERLRRLAVLAHTLELSWATVDTKGSGRTVLALCWPLAAGVPTVVGSRAPDDISYDVAIEASVNAIRAAEELPYEMPASHAQAPVTADGVKEPAPRSELIPVGKAKPAKTWKRNPWVWNAIIQILLVATAVPFLVGDPLGGNSERSVISIADGHVVSGIAGQDGNIAWVIVDGEVLARADFEKHLVTAVVDLGSRVTSSSVREGILYYVSTEKGEVGAWNLSTGSRIWSDEVGVGVRSLAFDHDSIVIASPVTHEVISLGIADGRLLNRKDVGGCVWDVASSEESVFAVLLDQDEVVTLAAKDFTVLSTVKTLPSPSRVILWDDGPRVHSQVTHALSAVREANTTNTIWTKNPAPEMSSDGTTLVIEGVDQISSFTSGKPVQRFLTEGGGGPLSVVNNTIVAADGSSLIQIRTKRNSL